MSLLKKSDLTLYILISSFTYKNAVRKKSIIFFYRKLWLQKVKKIVSWSKKDFKSIKKFYFV